MLHYTGRKKKSKLMSQFGLFWSETKKYIALATENNRAVLTFPTANRVWVSGLSDISRNSGNFVFEIEKLGSGRNYCGFSTDSALANYSTWVGGANNTAGVYIYGPGVISYPTTRNFTILNTTALGNSVVGDVFAFAFNMGEGKCYIFKNGVNLGAYFGGLTGKMITPMSSFYEGNNKTVGRSKTAEFKYNYPGYVGIGD